MSDDRRTRELLEIVAVRETLLRYARGIDRRDWDVLLSVFTDDVHAVFQGNDLGRDKQAIVDYITSAASVYEILSSVHAFDNMHIDIDGDHATAESTGVGYMTYRAEGSSAVLRMRNLRYVDRLVRQADGRWLISERILTNDWEVELPARTFG